MKGQLILPNSLKYIGEAAFSECRNIEGSIIIPDGITSIKNYTFSSCNHLESVTMSNNIESIGEYAFLIVRSCQASTYPIKLKSLEDIPLAAVIIWQMWLSLTA